MSREESREGAESNFQMRQRKREYLYYYKEKKYIKEVFLLMLSTRLKKTNLLERYEMFRFAFFRDSSSSNIRIDKKKV